MTNSPATPSALTDTAVPDRGRRRDSTATRAAILQAARRRFASEPFEQVGLREIAGDAGVDPALIVRYFRSKEELFKSIVEACGEAEEVWSGDRSGFGERVAREIANEGERSDGFEDILIALRSTASPRACALSQEALKTQLMEPLAAWLGGPEPEARTRLLTALFMGGVVSLAMAPSDYPGRDRFIERLALELQAIVDET
jgi:AcrR family transcriptional regulator